MSLLVVVEFCVSRRLARAQRPLSATRIRVLENEKARSTSSQKSAKCHAIQLPRVQSVWLSGLHPEQSTSQKASRKREENENYMASENEKQ